MGWFAFLVRSSFFLRHRSPCAVLLRRTNRSFLRKTRIGAFMKVKTSVRAGGFKLNRNGVKVKTMVRAGGFKLNHNSVKRTS